MTGWTIRRGFGLLLSLSLFLTSLPEGLLARQDASTPPASSREPQYATKTPEQLQQVVAPIALYPDSLVAQILAASTFPEEVVEADRWVQAHPNLKGDALAQAVSQQPWDSSVKALMAFPSVLGKMDKDLSVDLHVGRRLFQPGSGCDGGCAGDAAESTKRRQSEDDPAAGSKDRRLDNHY